MNLKKNLHAIMKYADSLFRKTHTTANTVIKKSVSLARSVGKQAPVMTRRIITWAKSIRLDRTTITRLKIFVAGDLWPRHLQPFLSVSRNRIMLSGGAAIIITAAALSALSSDKVATIEPNRYREPAPVDNSMLRIVQAAPTGTVTGDDRRKEVTVVFNHPLVPLSKLEDTTAGVLDIAPAIRGNFRWYGSRICAFIPETGWEFGRTYTITVRKGTTSLNGKALPENYSFTFTFTIPELSVSAHPIPYQSGTIDYNQSFSINFSHPVNLADLSGKVRLLCNNQTIPFKTTYWDPASGGDVETGEDEGYGGPGNDAGEPNRRAVIITPTAPFKRDAAVTITVEPGLRAADGAAELKNKKLFTYATHGPLSVAFKQEGVDYYQNFWQAQFEFNNDVDISAARTAIKVTPSIPWRESSRGRTRSIALTSWSVKPGTAYKFTVGPMTDIHGNALVSGDREIEVTVPEYRPEFSLEDDKTLLESTMSQKVPVEMANMPEIVVGVAPVTLKHIQMGLSDSRYSILDNLSYNMIEWKTGVGKHVSGRTGYDIRKYLTSAHTGWLGVTFTGDVISYNGKSERLTRGQIIQATDLGISVKEAFDSSYVWVHSLHRGAPVKGAAVTFYDIDNRIGSGITNEEGYCRIPKNEYGLLKKSLYVVSSGTGDRAFITSANYDLPMYYVCNQFDQNAWERSLGGEIIFDRKLYRPGDTVSLKGILAVREKGKLTPLRNAPISVTISSSKGEQLFSKDIKTSAQGGLWTTCEIPADAPLGHYQVRMALNDRLYVNDTFQVEEFRPVSFSVSVAGLRDASVGEKIPITIEGRYLFGAPMKSAPVTYNCMRMKRRISFPNYSDYTFGDGQLWEETEIDWSNAGYYTGDSGRLDSSGKYVFTLTPRPMLNQEKLQTPDQTLQLSDIYDLKIEAKVKDVDDKSVTKTAYATVYPGSFLIGIRSKNRYQHFSKQFSFDLVALTNDGRHVESRPAVITVIRYNYKNIMSKGPGGTLQPRNMLVKEQVLRQEITLSGAPRTFTFQPADSGGYSIIVQERGGMSYSRDNFYAWGGEMVSWYLDDDDAITLMPDKKEYQPGETARVLIQSPFSRCKAIITLERESVIWQKTMDISENGTPIEIPMKEEYLPNVFLSVMLVRPRVNLPETVDPKTRAEYIANDMGIPKFKAGIVKLSVSNASKKAKLDLVPNKSEYSPGEPVTVTITTEPGAEVALAVADRAVLDLIDYQYANPVNKLYQNWPLGVRILENRRFIIKQYRYTQKGESPGGQGKGDELEGLGGFDKDSEDGSRKDIRYTAYWNPSIIADTEGKATVTFTLPHNLTTFRIMALASINGKYRNANHEFRVRKALVIQKNLPRFIRPGDTLSLGAVVINQTNRGGEFIFSIQSDLLQGKETTTTAAIDAGEAKEITFPVTLNLERYAALKKMTGNSSDNTSPSGQISVKGWLSVKPVDMEKYTGGGFKKSDVIDRLEFNFPVREQPPDEAFTVAGFTSTEEKEFIQFPAPGSVMPEMGGLELALAPTALVGLNRAFAFYKTNPFFCLEQRASAFLLAMSSGELLKQFSFKPPSDRDFDFSRIEELFLGEIDRFQNADGGFKFWKDSTDGRSDPYLTAYVAFILQVAKQRGYRVQSSVVDKVAAFLENYVREPREDGYKYIFESFALINYVLTLKGDHNASLTDLLLDNEQKLSLRAKAYLAMAIGLKKGISDYKDDNHAKRIMEAVKNRMDITTRKVSFKEEGTDNYNRAFSSNGSTLGVILRMMIMLDRTNPLIPNMVQFIIADQGSSVWHDSHSTGLAALALHDYYQAYEKEGSIIPAYTGTVSINGKTAFEPTLDRRKLEVRSTAIPMRNLYAYGPAGVNHPMVFSSSKNNRLYYTATLAYFPLLSTVAPRDEGMEIQRDIIDLGRPSRRDRDGTIIRDNLKRGSIYLVRIRVVTPKPVFNALVVDPIPSNVEIVNTALKTEESSLGKLTTKDRPAYEYWWMDALPTIEYRDDRVVITQDYLAPGLHEFTYLVRPLLKGRAQAPAAVSKLMYEPETFGRTGTGFLVVQ
ncbi:MAG: hypothetical protein A2176_06290 [Spirochaetes bacterium RBG_13_51_14]|nr:MAG: hypothetical protein A2176_06290 [Spirochaetes bacterium RBG_13_51_14]